MRASRFKNPINDVGAKALFGIDDPLIFKTEKIDFSGEIRMTPEKKINELSGFEKTFFKTMFAGKFAENLYKIYTYKK